MPLVFDRGRYMPYTNPGPAAVAVGGVVPLGNMIGIATVEIAAGATENLDTEGVYELPADNTVAFAQGEQLYWNAGNGVLTNVAAGNTAAGKAFAAKVLAGATAWIKLNA